MAVRDSDRIRCDFVFSSKRRCSNTARLDGRCDMHQVVTEVAYRYVALRLAQLEAEVADGGRYADCPTLAQYRACIAEIDAITNGRYRAAEVTP